MGCSGGWPTVAWNYYATHGLVTGSDFDQMEGCKPNIFNDFGIALVSFGCTLNCENKFFLKGNNQSEYTMQYLNDKHFGAGLVTTISREDADHNNKIKLEMFKNGPVTTLMKVPDEKAERARFDKDASTGKIYSDNAVWIPGKNEPDHAIRLLGWGVEKDVHYWIVANSWGTSWGTNGTFKIKHGSAMIDDLIMFGMPDLDKKFSCSMNDCPH